MRIARVIAVAAFPKTLTDFGPDHIDDATNCAGGTPAWPSLYLVLLAGVGLAVVASATVSIGRAARSEKDTGPDPSQV